MDSTLLLGLLGLGAVGLGTWNWYSFNKKLKMLSTNNDEMLATISRRFDDIGELHESYKEHIFSNSREIAETRDKSETHTYEIQGLVSKQQDFESKLLELNSLLSKFQVQTKDTQEPSPVEELLGQLVQEVNQLVDDVEENLNINQFKEIKDSLRKVIPAINKMSSQFVGKDQFLSLESKIDAIGRFLSSVEIVDETEESEDEKDYDIDIDDDFEEFDNEEDEE